MKKNTILYILLAFLIVVNGFFIFKLIGEKNTNKDKGRKNPISFIKKQLDFNASQLENLEDINKEHHQKMRRINNDIKELKDVLFNKLSDVAVDEKAIDSITTLIGEKQKAKEIEIYYHFKSIQELCDDKQKIKFKKIIKDALRRGGNEDRLGHPDRPGGHRPPPPNGF